MILRILIILLLIPTSIFAGNTVVFDDAVQTLTNKTIDCANNTCLNHESNPYTWIDKATTYTASNGDGIRADTSGGAWTLTLPLSPSSGDDIAVKDVTKTFATYNLTVDMNGSKFMGADTNLICDVKNASFSLIYTDATYGWEFRYYTRESPNY